MRILFLNQFFWPDTAATGQLLSDVAEHLVASGETVHVICGSANYGGSNSSLRPQVGVTRLRTSAYSGNPAGRVGSYLSFLAGAFWHGLRCPAPDIVVTLTTPPLISLVGLAIQKFRGARHVIWEMDVYPDIAVDLGVLKQNGLSTRLFAWLADLPRRRADYVIALGECMRLRLLSHGLAGEKIRVAEHWADCDASPSDETNVRPNRSGGLSIMYSGNFGRAHDAETIAAAMAKLDGEDDSFRFTFAGGGSQHAWMRDFSEQNRLSNALFLPYCGREELKGRLAFGDIGLVTQRAESAGAIVPSKSYGIIAAGRPLLFVGPRNSTTAQMIDRFDCGWQIDCGDVEGLVQLLRYLADNKEVVYSAGARAYEAFVNHYQRSQGVTRMAAAVLRETADLATAPLMPLATDRATGTKSYTVD